MPALAQYAPSGETIYGKLRRLYNVAKVYGHPHAIDRSTFLPQLTAAGDTPVINLATGYTTVSAITSAGYSNAYTFTANPNVFYATGGTPIYYSGGWRFAAYTLGTPGGGAGGGNITAGKSGASWRISFIADAAKVVLTTGYGYLYRILVNDRFVSLPGYVAPSNSVAPILLDFTSAGGRQRRKITIEGSSAAAFQGAYVGPTEQIYAPPALDRLRMIVAGDSIAAGSGLTNMPDNFAQIAGDILGISDVWDASIGGTGYFQDGNYWRLSSHISDITANAPDIVLLAMNVNDLGASISAPTTFASVKPELASDLAAIRAAAPAAPIFIIGVLLSASTATYGTVYVAYEQLLQAFVQALGDPNIFFISCASDPTPWLTGTGHAANQLNDGSSDKYVASALSATPAIVSGGANYAVNDLINLPEPVVQAQPAQLKVTAVSGGVITGVSRVLNGNHYTIPANPVPQGTTTGGGTGATFTCSWGTASPHTGCYAYQMFGERLAASIMTAIGGKL